MPTGEQMLAAYLDLKATQLADWDQRHKQMGEGEKLAHAREASETEESIAELRACLGVELIRPGAETNA